MRSTRPLASSVMRVPSGAVSVKDCGCHGKPVAVSYSWRPCKRKEDCPADSDDTNSSFQPRSSAHTGRQILGASAASGKPPASCRAKRSPSRRVCAATAGSTGCGRDSPTVIVKLRHAVRLPSLAITVTFS
jgi:hypothetical protein